ncbi:MAG: ornithine carbamoyltransferase [Alphaproteobacteria bacterium]|nr:ornithine carbamoyltransferase [Alphaproteobacteria bacterium]
MTCHFLDIADHDNATLTAILADADAMKSGGKPHADVLAGKTVAMIFEKPSTRTRVSFEVGIHQLGGTPLVMRSEEMQLGRGETVADTARVLSGYVDAIMIRTSRHEILTELASYASVPVINGLKDRSHPCHVMADVKTMAELKAPHHDFSGLKVAWLGDGNNVAASWIEAARIMDFNLDLAVPSALAPDDDLMDMVNGTSIRVVDDPMTAASDADVIVTDTWSSMGMPGGYSNSGDRQELLRRYQVNDAVMAVTKAGSVFMHCLPVYRGQEATAEVVDGPQSVIWQEAENRLHVQKAIMAFCMINGGTGATGAGA